jgi:hypothetical protein
LERSSASEGKIWDDAFWDDMIWEDMAGAPEIARLFQSQFFSPCARQRKETWKTTTRKDQVDRKARKLRTGSLRSAASPKTSLLISVLEMRPSQGRNKNAVYVRH